jgi:exodeoxyribonuclease VII large subunit
MNDANSLDKSPNQQGNMLTHIGGSKIFDISDITKIIKKYLEGNKEFNNVWLRGEISNFKKQQSGHMYFDLKDTESVVPCVMFLSANRNLKFKPEHGMKVLGFGSISVYVPYGKYQFILTSLMPDGVGALHMAFMQLKGKLSKEGLFAVEHKKPIPKFPRTIGVVTSPTGAAIRDIIQVISRRFPKIEILITPSRVQGEEAAGEIAKGIETLNKLDEVDLVIIGRGGGSLEDLWAFNEEIVARAIYNSKKPIISAVGHETDFTISDFVADIRAPTPSAAAELAVPDMNEILQSIKTYTKQLHQIVTNNLTNNRLYFNRLMSSPVLIKPFDRINLMKQNLDNYFEKLSNNISNYYKLKRSNLDNYLGKLAALDPEAILGRGYSITMKLPGQTLVSSVDKINEDDMVNVIFKDGKIKCFVKEKDDSKKVKNDLQS